MSCQYFIKNKNRKCRNKQVKGTHYCSIKTHKLPQQHGGETSEPVDKQYISPYAMIASELPPNPRQNSWYHYQAPVYQTFGDYVCIKKSFIMNAKNLLNEVFTEHVKSPLQK